MLMEGDPHLLLEGMALAAYAVGASIGYIYIRGEYEAADDAREDDRDQDLPVKFQFSHRLPPR